jgi:hypothetical protein
MELAGKENIEDALARWEAFWAGEIIRRPLVVITGQTKEGVSAPTYRDKYTDIELAVAKAVAVVENTEYWGEAMPFISPNLGPDQYGAWFGTELHFAPGSEHTNWIEPFVKDWRDVMPLRIQKEGVMWRKNIAAIKALTKAGQGKFLVGMLDFHSNYDALSAIRGPENLSMDFYDNPELLKSVGGQMGDTYPQAYRDLEAAGDYRGRGYIGTAQAYSKTRFAVTQCDFACMLSREMFSEFVIPELRKEWSFLDHTIYHFDGVGALQHMPTLLAEPDVDVIQWVPGAGQKEQYLWDDLFIEIQKAGKGLDIYAPPEHVKRLSKILRPEKVIYHTSCKTKSEAEDLLAWLENNT